MGLACNVVAFGNDRVISIAAAKDWNNKLAQWGSKCLILICRCLQMLTVGYSVWHSH